MANPVADENEEFEFAHQWETENSANSSPQPTAPSPGQAGTPGLNSAPFSLPDLPKRTLQGTPARMMTYQNVVNPQFSWSDKATAGAQKGVDVASGGPYGLRNMVELGTNPQEQVNHIRRYFGDKGVKAPEGREIGRIGPETGQPEFYDTGSGRYTTVSSMSPVPFTEAPTVPGVVKGAAVTAGAAAGTGAFSTAAGAGLAGYGVEAGKHVINQWLRTSTDLQDPKLVKSDAITQPAVAGAIDAGTALIGSGVANVGALGKYLRYGPKLFSSEAFNPKYWPAIKDRMAEAAKTLSNFHELAGSNALKLDVSQLSDHPAVNVGLASAINTREDNAVAYAVRGQDNTTELQRVFNKVTDAIKGSQPPMTAGPEIQNWALENRGSIEAQHNLLQQAAQDEAKRAVDGLPAVPDDQIKQSVTQRLQGIEQDAKARLDTKWGDVAVKLGKPPAVAYSKDSDWLLQPQLKAADFQLTPVGKTKIQNLITEAVKAGRTDADIMGGKINAIPSGFVKVDEESGELVVDDKAHDMYDVINTIKALRSQTRADMARVKGHIPPEEQDVARVAETLRNDVTYNLVRRGDPSILDTLEDAEQATKEYSQTWRQGVLSDVAKKADGFNYPVTAQSVQMALFQSGKDQSKTAVGELANIAKGDPDFEDSIRHSILAIYKNHYTDNGVPTPALHSKFVQDMEGPIQAFFDTGEQAKIQHLGTLGDVVAKRSNDLVAALQKWKSSPFGRLGAMNSTTISRAAFSNAKGVVGIGNFLRQNNPELLKQLQSDTAQQIAGKVLGSQDKAFNQGALRAVLDPVRGRGVSEIMPPEYLNGLRTIQNTSRLLTGSGNTVLPEENTLIHRAVRLMTGAFGKEARAYHLVRGFRERQAARMMYNVLSDPDKLARFMVLKDQSPRVAKAAGFLATVGGQGLDYAEGEESQ